MQQALAPLMVGGPEGPPDNQSVCSILAVQSADGSLRRRSRRVAAISIDATDPAYEKQLLEWRKTRLAELTADDGWLTVVGLLWMHQGANHAGSGSGMDLKMPSPAPQELGHLHARGRARVVRRGTGRLVRVAGQPVTAAVAVETDKTLLELGPLQMLVIRRGKRVGLRVRDRDSAARRAFKGSRTFRSRKTSGFAPGWSRSIRHGTFPSSTCSATRANMSVRAGSCSSWTA